MHDFNGGIPLNQLFWTVELPKHAVTVVRRRGFTFLRARDVPVIDSFQIFGPNVIPASVSFAVWWKAVESPMDLGQGGAVSPTDPAAFLGRFAAARAAGWFSGSEIGFSFASNPDVTSDLGYAELGTERNGAFL